MAPKEKRLLQYFCGSGLAVSRAANFFVKQVLTGKIKRVFCRHEQAARYHRRPESPRSSAR